MKKGSNLNLHGLKILSFESRRAQEMAELIRNYGGEPILAPSIREVALGESREALDFVRRLEAGEIDVVIFLTGVGLRMLLRSVESRYGPEQVAGALRNVTVVARGPKPVAVLRDLGLKPDISIPEPNTWREILATLEENLNMKDRRVAVQEYGISRPELLAGLERLGARVLRIPVYRWSLPEDTGPLRDAIGKILTGQVDVALFTNATQVHHLFRLAEGMGKGPLLPAAFRKILVASVGPVCSEALESFGLPVDLEPEHPKMGHLLAAAASSARRLLEAKRNPARA